MTFSVPQSKKSLNQNRFEFDHEGTTYSVPLMKFVPAGSMEAFEAGKETTGLILAADNDKTRDLIRGLDADQIEALVGAWGEASGITVGESGGSLAS